SAQDGRVPCHAALYTRQLQSRRASKNLVSSARPAVWSASTARPDGACTSPSRDGFTPLASISALASASKAISDCPSSTLSRISIFASGLTSNHPYCRPCPYLALATLPTSPYS